MTGWAVGLGDGRGPGRGPGRGTAGLGSLLCGISAVIATVTYPSRGEPRAFAAHRGAISCTAEKRARGPAGRTGRSAQSRQTFKQLGGSRAAALALPAAPEYYARFVDGMILCSPGFALRADGLGPVGVEPFAAKAKTSAD